MKALLLVLVWVSLGVFACKSAPSSDGKDEATTTERREPETMVAPQAERALEDKAQAPAPPARAKVKRGLMGLKPRGLSHGSPLPPANTEDYAAAKETGFQRVADAPLSTFSIDTDTASYSNVRRMLRQGRRPPAGAVRIEELINYFSYDYPPPVWSHPFSASVESAPCPWDAEHELVRIGLRARTTPKGTRKPANLVFLLDVSGSMGAENKLPLLQRSLGFAVNQLEDEDRVAIVVYAGASGLALPSTPFSDRARILEALNNLEAGGSTNAGDGIELAYAIAKEHFIQGGINRVILATDGDFNVGITDKSELVSLVKGKAKQGVFLTVLGFGMGNLKDDTLEKLADNGNGSYAYIDDFAEARKVFGEQIGGTLETVAKDVKIQVEFDPAKVSAYRLIGYENRRLAAEDFRDDAKDAGEIGAGHTVTALYQVVPARPSSAELFDGKRWMTVRLRYKPPDGDASTEAEFPVSLAQQTFNDASSDFRFAASVAAFGLLLSDSEEVDSLTFHEVEAWAARSQGKDPHGHRKSFLELVRLAKDPRSATAPHVPSDDCGCPPGDPLCDCL